MPRSARTVMRLRERLVIAAVALLGVLTATPGVHAFELVLPRTPAVLVSHGLAGLLLWWAVRRWRAARRSPTPRPIAS